MLQIVIIVILMLVSKSVQYMRSQVRYSTRLVKSLPHSLLEVISSEQQRVPLNTWINDANQHNEIMEKLLYPPYTANNRKVLASKARTLLARTHAASQNAIYNFIHNYYQFTAQELKKYSPGLGVVLEGADISKHRDLLMDGYFRFDSFGAQCDTEKLPALVTYWGGIERIQRLHNVLRKTSLRAPFFGCFGMHEWAMLYSNNSKHQEQLPLRVSQQTIDSLVSSSGALRCTHYDAFRFFHPAAQSMNAVHSLNRDAQARYEQPGCIHANMDLFMHAYTLYPYVSSALLVQALELALSARIVDMRASPYDVSGLAGCEVPICVETPAGRKLYIEEQERLAAAAVPIRQQLLQVYDKVLGILPVNN